MSYDINTLKGELTGFEEAGVIFKKLYSAESALINLVFPDIILTAFACEIAIKGIFYLDKGQEIKGQHGLKDLFARLDVCIQNDIKNSIQDFDQLLEQTKDVFVDWRYLYENTGQKTVCINFLDGFLKALHAKLYSYSS